ncbi:MAG TPA: peptidase M14 [Planctomycetota bacterium]|nr:peptidase M14 [Planctomycetota bacterium]
MIRLLSLLALLAFSAPPDDLQIDAAFPGGNIIVDKIDGDTVSLHQDLRDTNGQWFYWQFRVRGAQGRTLHFQFTKGDVVSVLGPAVSLDGGESWAWPAKESSKPASFQYAFPADARDLRFCLSIPYLEKDLRKFLDRHKDDANLKVETHCETKKGRKVERLRVGHGDLRILLTARHHACEMTASYVLEGILEEALVDPWFKEKVEIAAVPFMDKDGVEDGDQGKNRKPRDHNRDYDGESIHESTKAMRAWGEKWADGKLKVALDIHSPTLRGADNGVIYFVGTKDQENWKKIVRLSEILESTQTGPLHYQTKDNLPYGTSWNKDSSFTQGLTCSGWARHLPGIEAAASIEVSYTNVHGTVLTAENARLFGRDLARAIRKFLE